MAKNTVIDHEQIAREAAAASGLPIKTVSNAMDAVLAAVADNLSKGHTVQLGGFGTFSVPQKEKRAK
jgi:nucleoid DNA-binding protein